MPTQSDTWEYQESSIDTATPQEASEDEDYVPQTPEEKQTQHTTVNTAGSNSGQENSSLPEETDEKGEMSPDMQHLVMASHVNAFAKGGLPGLARLKAVFPNICRTFPDCSWTAVLKECGLSSHEYDFPRADEREGDTAIHQEAHALRHKLWENK